MEPRECDLGSAGQVEVVPLDPVDVHLVGREEPGPVHGALANEDGGEDGHEPPRGDPLEREAVEGELDERRVTEAVGEAGARDLRPPLHVDPPELEMVARPEAEGGRLADSPELVRILLP